jgi:hypothetical protein
MKPCKFTMKIILILCLVIGISLILAPVSAACAPGYHSCGGRCVACPSGSILGSDCKCHQQCGSSNTYCTSGKCCNGHCTTCPDGSILGSDCKCHQQRGTSNTYCTSGKCCDGHCATCPSGSILGDDCKCHKSCGSSGTYCSSGSCCDGNCVSCSSGYLGTDCKCHSQGLSPTVVQETETPDTISVSEDQKQMAKEGITIAKILKFLKAIF